MTQRNALGLILGGGGSRAAYQVGVLSGIAERHPKLSPEILNGVSAGAINAAAIANHTGNFKARVDNLVALWSQLTVDQVFRTDASSLVWHLIKNALSATLFGGRGKDHGIHSMVDTAPLRAMLTRVLAPTDGTLTGIEHNLENTNLEAVSLAGMHYVSGHTVTWFQGHEPKEWNRKGRHGVNAKLGVEHVMASAALPGFFPAIKVDGAYYGDGGIRQHAPLAPAVHLGAQRILAISTRFGNETAPFAPKTPEGYPQPAQIMGVLMNAVFLDVLDRDVARMRRLNELLQHTPPGERGDLREIDIVSVRPSVDLGRLAGEFEPQLPSMFRFLTRRMGTKQVENSDALSMVMFQPDYLQRLIAIGRADAEEHATEIDDLLT